MTRALRYFAAVPQVTMLQRLRPTLRSQCVLATVPIRLPHGPR